MNKVTIGDNTSIGDRAVVHVAKIQGNYSTSIGNHVTIGPGAVIHAATIGDFCRIGAMAQILDGSTIHSNSIIAPGSIVSPGTNVGSGELWAGSPAKHVSSLTPQEIATIAEMAMEIAELASLHAYECSKDYKQLAQDEEMYYDNEIRDEDYWSPTKDAHVYDGDVLGQGPPGRIFNSTLTHPEEGLKLNKTKT